MLVTYLNSRSYPRTSPPIPHRPAIGPIAGRRRCDVDGFRHHVNRWRRIIAGLRSCHAEQGSHRKPTKNAGGDSAVIGSGRSRDCAGCDGDQPQRHERCRNSCHLPPDRPQKCILPPKIRLNEGICAVVVVCGGLLQAGNNRSGLYRPRPEIESARKPRFFQWIKPPGLNNDLT
jgi:hypothetical protein